MLQTVLLLITLLKHVSCQGSLTELPSGIQQAVVGVRSVQQSASSATTTSAETTTTTTETPSATITTTETTASTPVSQSSSSATTTATETPSATITTTETTSSTLSPAPTPIPTLAPAPSSSELAAVDTMISTDSTEKEFVWQGATRVMVGGCFDIQPPSGDDCSQQKQLGKCSRNWMFEGGLCAKTCGFCEDECFDIQPTLDYTCAQEKTRNQCSRIGDNFCRSTCGRCIPSATSIEELAKTPISPKTEKEPTPTPTPTTTPKEECSCEQCGDVSMQQVLDAVEVAVAKVVKEFMQ